jgi:stage III sporulation protein SpoIIIAA
MMVTKLTEQSNVMIECVQNHTPHVMIIDEIGRPQEVEAARTCKQRGVRMISSAHGNLKTLMKNAHLKGLIGGIELVTVGDEEAKKGGSLNKLKAQRQGEPVFDVIIELTRENTNIWTVIPDTAKAVDSMLERKPYTVEIRSRDPLTNIFSMRLETLS